jgi:two-component sensor histidine kinase
MRFGVQDFSKKLRSKHPLFNSRRIAHSHYAPRLRGGRRSWKGSIARKPYYEKLSRVNKCCWDEKDELIRHKDLMNRESDHRLMNGLQMVSSLLSLQSREAQNAKTAEQLKIAANRVATIGSVHQRLHALDHARSVELKGYLENLCEDMTGILPAEAAEHNLAVEGIALEIPTAIGIPLGYIVSELVTNSAKYAKGKITVRLDRNPGKGYELSVSDDGPGFPEGFDPKKSKGLGMKIVSSLVNQIGGQSLFGPNHLGRSARFTVLFTLNERAAIA